VTPQEKDKNYIWHPFTQMKIADTPIHITRAKGTILYSTDGKEYIDAVSSWWVNIHGHSNEFIADRIAQQAKVLEHVIFAGFTHTPAIELAERLINILPDNFSKIFYSDNGSTAVEVALKMALQYWHNQGIKNKTKIIAFDNAYHGDTFGAMSAGARSTFNAAFNPLLFEVRHIPAPDKNNIEAVKKQLLQYAGDGTVAAFIFEPLIQGSGGMLMHEAIYLDELLSIAQQKNIICIADEVMTGFGRTGKNFAINYLENKPDIICLSKGITGGFLPLGVTACSQKIFDAFYSDEMEKTFFHGHSYTANPLACAAANASIELLLKESCQRQIKMINDNHQLFAEKMDKSDLVKEVRLQGTIIAIELNTSEDTSYFNSIKKEAYKFYLNNGVLLRPLGNVVYIMPPYCITKEELDKVYAVIVASLTHLL
jgi:adenosylmethionine-8-amino-7-oxononanoate aminotransferase